MARHALYLIILLLALALTTPAKASEMTPQFLIQLQTTEKVSEKVDLGIYTCAFFIPGKSPMMFTYLGPGFQVNNVWWISARTGVETGMFGGNPDVRPILSVWNSFDPHKRVSMFLETEVYPSLTGEDDPMHYYGYYGATTPAGKYMRLGLHAEQGNTDFTVGPDVKVSAGKVSLGVQEFWDMDSGHQLRVGTTLNF